MQIHILKAQEIINEFLPFNYVKLTLDKLNVKKITVTPGTIRNVKQGKGKRLDIIEALVEVALDNKKQIKKIEKLTA